MGAREYGKNLKRDAADRSENPSSLYSVAVDGRPVYSSHLRDQAMQRFIHQRASGRGEVTLSIDGDVAYRAGKGGAMRVGNPYSPTNLYLASAPRNSAGVCKPIVCRSGLSFSVQAGEYHYCSPRRDVGPWVSVEVGFPSSVVEALLPYAERDDDPLDTVYGWVPVEVVDDIIVKNGGLS